MKPLGVFGGILILVLGIFALVPNNADSSEVSSIGSSHTNNNQGNSSSNEDFPPNFTLETLDGEEVSLSDFRGKKAVVIDFWASWCPNCRRDMPVMQKFYEKYGDKVEVIAVNLQENKRTVERYVSSEGFTYPILLDPRASAARLYGVNYTNYHVLIDKDGYFVKTVPGDISEADFRSLAI